jgi:hypothetical protein
MKPPRLRLLTGLVTAALLLLQSSQAQTANQWFFQKKNTEPGFTGYGVTPIAGRAFGLDGSGNPAMISVSGGSGLENILSSITGDTLTFTGTLTAPRAIAWRDLAGTVAFTSDLSAYLTTSTASSTYAPLASPTFTGTVTIPSGASISGYLTTASAASSYQPLDSDLTSIAGLTSAADRLPYYTGAGTAALATFTSTARSLLDDSSTAAMRGTLGIGSIATQSNASVNITGGVISGVTFGALGVSVGAAGISIEDPLNGSNISNLYGASGASPSLYLPATGTVLLSNLSSVNADNLTSGSLADARLSANVSLLGQTISLTTEVTGTLPIANGGTGETTVSAARIALLPSMTGNGGKFLRVNAGATDYEVATISGGGDALTSGTLAQFAATTSAQLRSVLSDENGTGEFLTTNGSAASLTSFPTLNQSTTGNAATATALQTGRTINGTSFDGTANITVTAAAGTLTGTTLASGVTASSLTSLGTIATGVWQGTAIADSYISSAATWNAKEAALTFSTGLTRSTNTITVNTSQNIATLSNLTTNGILTTTGGAGTLTVDTTTKPKAEAAEIGVAISDETTAITTGTAKITFRMPFAMTVTAVRLSLTTVSSSGTPTVDINEAGTTILSTKLSCDASEKTSTTAAAAAVISDTALADDAEITIDVDTAGTGATGAKVWIIGTR